MTNVHANMTGFNLSPPLGVLNLPQNFMSCWDFNSVDAASRGVLLTRSQRRQSI